MTKTISPQNRCLTCKGYLLPTSFGWIHETTPAHPHAIVLKYEVKAQKSRDDHKADALLKSVFE